MPWKGKENGKQQGHGIIESLEFEGTSEGRLVQLPGNEQGHPQLDEVAQGLIQPYLESLQGRGINHITGQPVTVPYHSHCRRFFPYIQPKSTLFELEAIFPCSITTDPAKQSPSFLYPLFRYWKATLRSPWSLLFSVLNSPSSLSVSLQGDVPPLGSLKQVCKCEWFQHWLDRQDRTLLHWAGKGTFSTLVLLCPQLPSGVQQADSLGRV